MLPQAKDTRPSRLSSQLSHPARGRLTPGWLAGVLAVAVMTLSQSAHAEGTERIRRYATFTDTRLESTDTSRDVLGERRRFKVDNRTLTMSLQDNADLLGELAGGGALSSRHLQMQRGQLEGKPGSWVRLTRSSQGVNGLIWDGQQMYVVAPAAAVTSNTTTNSASSVIYKLSDVSVDLSADYCGNTEQNSNTNDTNGLQAYAAVVNELAATTGVASSTSEASLRLEMQVLADAAFRGQYASDDEALAALMTRINNVDGIFRNQLGLAVQATNIQFLREETASLSESSDANTLLSSLAQLRGSSSLMASYPVTHLVTGRDLSGDTLGIAYIGQICGSRYGVSLSEVRSRGVWIDSLVMAHELGHQLGAVHDGSGACESADSHAYLMSANINGASDFSACSKQIMRSTMASSACIVPADLPLLSTATQQATQPVSSESGGGAFNWMALSAFMLMALMRGAMRRSQPNAAPSHCPR